ncbi:minor tail protein with lysin activity [Mycobacterium phage Hawkeye]|uniref:D-ala-D-ala carboxypeptidase n=1 Tax=Mycobacterium phage Hawkeye TaxID=1458711 RepID=X2KYU1_9CAUD|nr:minor tail protein with lysin activity [Mycobacterium phage Hawkeye]AHN84044.1 D-Ala-D-Ala carboxypeptidase [Mycobacterium phage Hawkeye]
MAIVGYNVYLVPAGGTVDDRIKITPSPIPGPEFNYPAEFPNTEYDLRMTAVDEAGLESPLSNPVSPLPKTLEYSPGDPLSPADEAAIDAIVAASMAESKQPGILIAVDGPRGKLTKAYGVTKLSGGRPLTIADHAWIASTTKTFTSHRVMRAVADGLLSLDDVVSTYIPSVPNGNLIKIRHLLQMRSGIYDYTQHPLVLLSMSIFPTASWNEATILSYIQSGTPYFTPGTAYQYNNGNFVLLGLILKKITGRYIRNMLMEDTVVPLGLTETTWPVNSSGYGVPKTPEPAATTSQWNPDMLGCAGGFTSTVTDLITWAKELRDHTLMDETIWEQWTDLSQSFWGYAAPFREGTPVQFGYGLGLESTGTWFGHNGSWFGAGCQAAFEKNTGATIAVSENLQTTTSNGPVPLAAYTTIFRKVAEYLYPGSMDDQVYPQP